MPGDYNVSFNLTHFPLVCPLASRTCNKPVCAPKFGPLYEPIFMHMHLCLLIPLHILGSLNCCYAPRRLGLPSAWPACPKTQAILHQPYSYWSVITFEDYVLGPEQIGHILRNCTICHACLLPCLLAIMYSHWLNMCRSHLLSRQSRCSLALWAASGVKTTPLAQSVES